jgi:hypothetical protein
MIFHEIYHFKIGQKVLDWNKRPRAVIAITDSWIELSDWHTYDFYGYKRSKRILESVEKSTKDMKAFLCSKPDADRLTIL